MLFTSLVDRLAFTTLKMYVLHILQWGNNNTTPLTSQTTLSLPLVDLLGKQIDNT